MRAVTVVAGILFSRDQSVSDIVRPSSAMRRVVRLLLACSTAVDHWQLVGLYGPSLSRRSRLCWGEGRGPRAAKKLFKVTKPELDAALAI